jgi:preprotein translocase subunit YajC
MDLSNFASFRWSEFWLESLLLAQEGQGAGGQPAGNGGFLESLFGSGYGMLLPFLLIFGAFYLMILLPERKRRAEHDKLLSGLKKNDRVVTTSGIIGVVVMAERDSKQVTLRIDEKTDAKMTVLRSAIAQVITNDADIDFSKSS